MNNAERLRHQVEVAFDEATMRSNQATRAVMADHGHRGLIRSGATSGASSRPPKRKPPAPSKEAAD